MLSSKAKRELKIDQRQVLIESIEIGIASPQQIYLRGSRQLPNGKTVGLIKNSKTVNYKKFTPFRDGLFCERIFGPVTSLVCACGKKQPHSKITFCEKCEVEYIDQRSRRYRLGYISLLSPVTHIWYLKGRPSYLSLFLGKRKKTVVSLAYCNGYLIDHIPLKKKDEHEYKSSCKCFTSLQNEDLRLQAQNEALASANLLARRFASCKALLCKKVSASSSSTWKKICTSPKTATFGQRKPLSVSHLSKNDNLLQNNAYKSLSFIKKKKDLLLQKTRVHHRIALACKCQTSCKKMMAMHMHLPLRGKKGALQVRTNLLCANQKFALNFGRANFRFATHATAFLAEPIFRFVQGGAARAKSTQRVAIVRPRKKICMRRNSVLGAKRLQKDQISLELNRFLANNRSAVNKNDFYRSTSYGKYFYTRQQCLPFLPSFVSHFYLRDALLNFMYSSPIYEDIPILEYCTTKRIEPLQDVHKFMARQTVDKFKNADLSVQSINSAFLPKIFTRRRNVAKLSFAQRDGEPRAPSCKRVHVSATSPLMPMPKISENRRFSLILGQKQGEQTKTGNVSKTSVSVFKLKRLYHGKKHVYLDSFFKKSSKQSTVSSTDNLTNKNVNEETNNTTLSNLELTAIREILSYTGGGAIQQLLKQFDPHDLCKFLVAERQILRVLYQKHVAFTRDGLDLWPSRALDYLSNVSEYQDNFSIIEKPFFSTAVRMQIENDRSGLSCPCPKGMWGLGGLGFTSGGITEGDGMACTSKTSGKTSWPCTCSACAPNGLQSKALHKEGGKKGMCMAIKNNIFSAAQSPSVMPERIREVRFVNKNEPVSKSPLNGFPLQEKGLFLGLENKKTQLYQKKEIMRISRRIYKVARRLKVAQLLTLNHRRPEWMILSHLPVLPPDLRPILQMSEKVIVASDLNIMYQRVIYRNNRHLRVRFIDFQLVTAIQRLVQDAVDRLMENGKGGSKPYYTQGGRPLKSLSDILKGKKGRFRLNLLGKRVDFSGRSVIVVAPSLKIHECGLPKDIALELYHYFLLRQLIVKKYCASIVTAKKMIKSKSAEMWDVLREVMYHHPVLLNRAPTLHRLGIQAFQPKLVVGSAIWLHPLVCSGFNADFDGDQMGVHLPLSFAARAESWDLLWSRNNLLSPATGQPMLVPSQDMVLGFYYMTAQGMANRFSNLKRLKTTAPCPCSTPLYKSEDLFGKKSMESTSGSIPEGDGMACVGHALAVPPSRARRASAWPSSSICITTQVNKIIVFLNPKSIITNYQNGILKLHTPVWLHWEGKIENENNSATPFELRVSGFGAQRYVFENYISNALFSGHANASALACKSKTELQPLSLSKGHAEQIFNLYSLPFGHEQVYAPTVQEEDLFFKDMGIAKTSFIFTQAKASYIRTTAGRVLMNNILKR